MNRFTFKHLLILSTFVFLLELFAALLLYNSSLRQRLNTLSLPLSFASLITPAPYPVLKSVLGAKTEEVGAHAAVVMDRDSQVVIFKKNANIRFSMASTVKIMTALTALDYYKPDDVLTIYTEGVEGVNVGFSKGQQVRFIDLLYAMLLPSGNDAALAISENYPGGKEAFVKKMNEKAQNYHLNNTYFEDPIGLVDDGDYTTAYDLARLADIALRNSTFSIIVKTKTKTIQTLRGTRFVLNNLNKLLGYNGIDGVKTGFTSAAGGVLVTSKNEKGKSLIGVIMKSEDRFYDTQILLDFVSENTSYIEF